MKRRWLRRIGRVLSAMAAVCLAGALAHADTVASLLGDFTINQYCGLKVARDVIDVHYVVVYGQLPALRELHAADTNGDGLTSQAERDAYVGKLAPELTAGQALTVDGVSVPLHPVRWSSSLPAEQGGFSLRVDIESTAALPTGAATRRRVEFSNRNFAGRIGWHEITVNSARDVAVFDTDAYDNSLTGGLNDALKSLPEAGPLDERSVHFDTDVQAPPHAVLLGARPGTSAAAVAAGPADRLDSAWITRETRRLVDSISAPTLEPKIAILALLGALVLGAVHALSPGHGKTIVGAYLIGSRGTPRHAVFLGLTVTITHTLGVFVLGFATWYASRFIVPERLFPILSLVSAALVMGMGVVLLVQRLGAARLGLAGAAGRAPTVFLPVAAEVAGKRPVGHFVLAPTKTSAAGTLHSHGGGPLHSHLPPGAAGEKITWRSLLTLGISGGLVPCPSAMVLLLAAVALNKTAYGMLLVVAFSVGLAMTLTVVGLAFLYARNRFRRPGTARWPLLLPVLSAATITLVGVALCIAALKSFSA